MTEEYYTGIAGRAERRGEFNTRSFGEEIITTADVEERGFDM